MKCNGWRIKGLFFYSSLLEQTLELFLFLETTWCCRMLNTSANCWVFNDERDRKGKKRQEIDFTVLCWWKSCFSIYSLHNKKVFDLRSYIIPGHNFLPCIIIFQKHIRSEMKQRMGERKSPWWSTADFFFYWCESVG